jgi:hydroxymethylpyrimidine pyrophosphatase-like HAD family hydrolase
MSAPTVAAVLDVFRSLGRAPQLYRRRGNEVHIYYTELNTLEAEFVRRVDAQGRGFDRFYHKVGQLRGTPAIFFSCQGTEAQQTKLAQSLSHIAGIRVMLYRDTYHDDNWFVEICREDAVKGRALERLRERLRADRVVVFGDNSNDISMFQVADLACSVANASEQAKNASDLVILSNEEDGVAKYLNSIYNRKL